MCVRPHGANDVQLQCGLKKKKKKQLQAALKTCGAAWFTTASRP